MYFQVQKFNIPGNVTFYTKYRIKQSCVTKVKLNCISIQKNKQDIFWYIWYPSTETKVNILNISVCLMSQAIQLLNLGTCITCWALREKRIYILHLFCSKCKLDAIFMDEFCVGHSPQILYTKKLDFYFAISNNIKIRHFLFKKLVKIA